MPKYDFSKLQNGSDIRGIALEGVEGQSVNLTETAVERLARGFVLWLSNESEKNASDLTISVGRDHPPSPFPELWLQAAEPWDSSGG